MALELAPPYVHPKAAAEPNCWSRKLCKQIRQFIVGRESALNLAVLRIVVLGTLLAQLDVKTILWIASLPPDLHVAPPGAAYLMRAMPVTETTALVSVSVCAAACVLGMIGLFSRTSTAVAALSGVYALMIVHLIPNTCHQQHLIWFAAILACSRCGDAFSIDSLLDAWRKARAGVCTRLSRSRIYAMPMRIIWVLFGMIYFFPGFWKLTAGYSEWIVGHGLIKAIHYKWAILDGWISPFRIDAAPAFCKMAQFATVAFELLFIAAIFFPLSRMIAAAAGLVFHNAAYAVMRIPFFQLQTCYVAFVDWQVVALWIGKTWFKRRSIVSFVNACEGCRESVATLRSFDLLRTNIFTCATISDTKHSFDLHAALSGEESSNPILLGSGLMSRPLWQILKRQHGSARSNMYTPLGPIHAAVSHNPAPVLSVGLMLILLNAQCGIEGKESGWPFACYPRYIIPQERIERLGLSLVNKDGKEHEIDLTEEWPFLSRYINRMWTCVWPGRNALPPYRISMLSATWSMLVREHPDWKRANAVRFYEESYSTQPEMLRHRSDAKKLIYEMRLAPVAQIASD